MKYALIDYVNHYRVNRWIPIPLHDVKMGHCSCPKSRTCTSAGKHPRVSQSEAKAATLQTWKDWIQRWPNMNLAVLTGSQYGFFVVDIDPRHSGDINFATFCQLNGFPPATLEAQSGGGGRHIYFSAEPGKEVKSGTNVLGQGIDIRGDGGIIVVEPSITQGEYKWL